MRYALLFLMLLCPSVVFAQSVAGTLTWVQSRPADLTSYKLSTDGAAAVSIGLPATNSTPVTLTVGTHTLVLSACYADTTCAASTPAYSVTVSSGGASTPLTYTLNAPADNLSLANGTSVTMSVTTTDNSGIAKVTGYWSVFGGAFSARATTKVGSTYTWTETPTSGAGTRQWKFVILAVDGESVTTTVRTITVH